MNYFFSVLRNFSFEGRARRAEFWWWFLIQLIIVIVLVVVSDAFGLNIPLGGDSPPAYGGYYEVFYLRIPVVVGAGDVDPAHCC